MQRATEIRSNYRPPPADFKKEVHLESNLLGLLAELLRLGPSCRRPASEYQCYLACDVGELLSAETRPSLSSPQTAVRPPQNQFPKHDYPSDFK